MFGSDHTAPTAHSILSDRKTCSAQLRPRGAVTTFYLVVGFRIHKHSLPWPAWLFTIVCLALRLCGDSDQKDISALVTASSCHD